MDKRIIASIVSLIATVLAVKLPSFGDANAQLAAAAAVSWVIGWLTPQPQGSAAQPPPDATFPAGGGK